MRSIEDVMKRIIERGGESWKKHVEANARPGESWAEAEERLRREKEREREEEQRNALAAPATGNVVRLPLWPDETRGVPNGILRSALFGAVRKGRRRAMDRELLASVEGVDIRYTGFRLDQNDLSVWESILHLAREQDLGEKCYITTYSLLKKIGQKNSGKAAQVLENSIERLQANGVKIETAKYVYIGSLISEAFKDKDTKEWVIVLNPRLKTLYELDRYTLIDWETRQALEGQQLAQWLHGFYASHAKPLPMRIETLHKLSGSETGRLRKFTENLRKALDALAEASHASGQRFSYEIRDGLVHVEKDGTPSQQRHLTKKQTPKRPKK